MTDTTVPTEILRQLGGARFKQMTGAKNCMAMSDDSLGFQLPARFASNRATYVKVQLTPADVYTVTFSKLRLAAGKAIELVEISRHDDIYNDALVDLFERQTGLCTRLTLKPTHRQTGEDK